jgi:hypothetical protein
MSRRIPLDDNDPAAPVNGHDTLASDRLDGAREIAKFWFGSDEPAYVKRAYRDITTGVILAGKHGGRVFASRKKLRQRYDQLTGGKR